MRPLVLAAAVAFLVAALVAAGWLGLVLASAVGGTTASGALTTRVGHRETSPQVRRSRRRAPWAERATRVCSRAHERTLDAIDAVVLDSPDLSPRERALRLTADVVRIEGRMLARLTRLRARPRGDRPAIRIALRTFRAEVVADRGALASVRRRWNPAVLIRRGLESRPVNERLRIVFLGLGASGCGTYFDAGSYT